MSRTMVEFHPQLRRGDAFLHNSPYHGNSHAADHTIMVPVIDDDGAHRFTVFAKAHQADIGNSMPTTYTGNALDVYNEGALIFPAVQVQRDYQHIDDVIRMCRLRIRVPEQWWGDYLALIGAARIGERELAGARPRSRLGCARRSCPAMARLQRATHDRRHPPSARRPPHARQHPRPLPGHAGRGCTDQGHRRRRQRGRPHRGRPA